MNSAVQSIVALVVVALAAGWLVYRSLMKKKNSGCGGGCGCPASEVKAAAATVNRRK
jgi:hypothetical protein